MENTKKEGLFEYNFRDKCKDVPNTAYLTHGIHSYIAKFIPQIPRYFIRKYTEPNKNMLIMDPFCGSGTTLVESKIWGVNSLGFEISKLGKFMAKVKTTPIDIISITKVTDELIKNINLKKKPNKKECFNNIEFWFDKKAINDLSVIKEEILRINITNKILEKDIKDFLLVCFSSILRGSSKADPGIPQPLITKRMREKLSKGREVDPKSLFKKSVEKKIKGLNDFTKISKNVGVKIVGDDSRSMDINNKIDLIVTSPPYINAQEYFRSQKLELFWLGLLGEDELREIDKKIIGTEKISVSKYRNFNRFGIDELDYKMKQIYDVDKKRAYIIFQYFNDMEKVISNCFKALKPEKLFCIVVGDNTIRGINIPTHNYISKICVNEGFKLVSLGVDKIKNRKLAKNRRVTDKVIDIDWIMLFRKSL